MVDLHLDLHIQKHIARKQTSLARPIHGDSLLLTLLTVINRISAQNMADHLMAATCPEFLSLRSIHEHRINLDRRRIRIQRPSPTLQRPKSEMAASPTAWRETQLYLPLEMGHQGRGWRCIANGSCGRDSMHHRIRFTRFLYQRCRR
jgi:hypothetical protein